MKNFKQYGSVYIISQHILPMQVYRNTDLLPDFRNAVLTIGTFDGVHTGHQQVITQMKKEAAEIQGETVIITFDPHPRTVINADSGIQAHQYTEEKTELLSEKGIDDLVIVPFTEKFAQLIGRRIYQPVPGPEFSSPHHHHRIRSSFRKRQIGKL